MQFLRRHVRGRPPHPDVLTPAEWRVLERLREGESNAEIAAHLDVSVNTVRTHVSSMLAELDLRDREEFGRWLGEPALATRTPPDRQQPTLLAGPVGWLHGTLAAMKPAVATGAAVLVGTAIVGGALVASRWGDDAPSTGAPAAVATREVTATPAPTPTSAAALSAPPLSDEKPTPTALPRFTPSPGARTIVGLFSTPRVSTPDIQRVLPPPPPESFSPWNRRDVVLYDLQAMTERNFGVGSYPSFTRDGRQFIWISGGQASPDQQLQVLDLDSFEQRTLGPARFASVVDESHVEVLLPSTNQSELVDITTGLREPLARPSGTRSWPPLSEVRGYRLEAIEAPQPYPYSYTAYRVVDTSGRLPPLEFDAFGSHLAADGKLFLRTPPVDIQPYLGAGGGSWGTSNVFEVDLDTGIASWIATTATSVPNSPFAVSARYVVWTDHYCKTSGSLSELEGRTRIYDRLDRTLTELDQGLFVSGITPSGELAVGPFGPDALIDVGSLTYRVRFAYADRIWSADYRYAAVGMTGGHGGLCFA